MRRRAKASSSHSKLPHWRIYIRLFLINLFSNLLIAAKKFHRTHSEEEEEEEEEEEKKRRRQGNSATCRASQRPALASRTSTSTTGG
uniref:Uncharacterized protein n=1 Tax=Oryza punctata TaxID=4537 RepID=A0A0E0KCJ8_ORYPU